MKSASQALITHLKNNHSFTTADVYTLTLKSGVNAYYTDIDVPVIFGGIVYAVATSGVPMLRRTTTRLSVGVTVDEMTVTVSFEPADTIGSAFWRDVARVGVLDGAKVLVQKAYLDAGGTCIGLVHIFEGCVADVESGQNSVDLHVKSLTETFNLMIPRSLYQSSCRNVLFSAGCGVSKAANATNSAISSVNNKASFAATTGKASGWFTSGSIVWLTGGNAGLSSTVKSFDGATFGLISPLMFSPQVGDTFTAYTGCDRTLSMCKAKFNNSNNYSGEPFTPKPEAML